MARACEGSCSPAWLRVGPWSPPASPACANRVSWVVLGRSKLLYSRATPRDARKESLWHSTFLAIAMLLTKDALICSLLLWGHHASAAPPSNAVGEAQSSRHPDAVDASSHASGRRKLTGRFLHITGRLAKSLIACVCWELTSRPRLPSRPILQDILEHRLGRSMPSQSRARRHLRRRNDRLRLSLCPGEPDVPVDTGQHQR